MSKGDARIPPEERCSARGVAGNGACPSVDSLLTLARADEGGFDHREPVPKGSRRDVYETAVILGEHVGLTVTMSVLEEGSWTATRRLRQLFSISSRMRSSTNRAAASSFRSVTVERGIAFTVRDQDRNFRCGLDYVFDRWRAGRAGVGSAAARHGLAISQWIAPGARRPRDSTIERLGRVGVPSFSPADVRGNRGTRSAAPDTNVTAD